MSIITFLYDSRFIDLCQVFDLLSFRIYVVSRGMPMLKFFFAFSGFHRFQCFGSRRFQVFFYFRISFIFHLDFYFLFIHSHTLHFFFHVYQNFLAWSTRDVEIKFKKRATFWTVLKTKKWIIWCVVQNRIFGNLWTRVETTPDSVWYEWTCYQNQDFVFLLKPACSIFNIFSFL